MVRDAVMEFKGFPRGKGGCHGGDVEIKGTSAHSHAESSDAHRKTAPPSRGNLEELGDSDAVIRAIWLNLDSQKLAYSTPEEPVPYVRIRIQPLRETLALPAKIDHLAAKKAFGNGFNGRFQRFLKTFDIRAHDVVVRKKVMVVRCFVVLGFASYHPFYLEQIHVGVFNAERAYNRSTSYWTKLP